MISLLAARGRRSHRASAALEDGARLCEVLPRVRVVWTDAQRRLEFGGCVVDGPSRRERDTQVVVRLRARAVHGDGRTEVPHGAREVAFVLQGFRQIQLHLLVPGREFRRTRQVHDGIGQITALPQRQPEIGPNLRILRRALHRTGQVPQPFFNSARLDIQGTKQAQPLSVAWIRLEPVFGARDVLPSLVLDE